MTTQVKRQSIQEKEDSFYSENHAHLSSTASLHEARQSWTVWGLPKLCPTSQAVIGYCPVKSDFQGAPALMCMVSGHWTPPKGGSIKDTVLWARDQRTLTVPQEGMQ